MAAPSTVYKDYMTRRRKGGTTPVDIDLYIAKFLQNTTAQSGDTWGDGYFNAADIPPTAADWSAANAKIKSIFKVDGFLCVPKGTTENGFIGFCYSRTSGNGLYHKTERFSGVRVPTTAHADAELLNDGGLNRKPVSDVVQDHANQVWWANMYSVRILARSAFYANTTRVGYDFKINSGAWTRGLTQLISLAPKTFGTYEVRQQDFGASQGDTIYLRAFATNEEGERISETIYSHALGDKISHLLALKVTNINDTTGTSTEIFMTQPDEALIADLNTSSQSLGIEGFTSDLMNTEIADGYYKGLDPANPNRVFTYAGEFTKYDIATGQDSEGLPTGMPRLYKNFAFALVEDTAATGFITDGSEYLNVIAIGTGVNGIGANVRITGMGTGVGRYAEIYLRRTNAVTPSVNEDVPVGSIYIEPNVQFDTSFYASLSNVTIPYDKFSFIEII